MKRCFLSSISAVLIRDFQSVHPKNLLALQYARDFLPSCITCLFLSLSIHRYIFIFKMCDRASLFFASDVAVVDVIVTRKTFKSQIFVFGGLGNFPQKIFSQTNYLYINNSLQEICCSFFEALSINERFQLSYSRFNSAQSKNSHNNRAFLFPFSRKKIINHFRLISFTGLNRHTETNDNYCKLKKKASALRPLGLLFNIIQAHFSCCPLQLQLAQRSKAERG